MNNVLDVIVRVVQLLSLSFILSFYFLEKKLSSWITSPDKKVGVSLPTYCISCFVIGHVNIFFLWAYYVVLNDETSTYI